MFAAPLLTVALILVVLAALSVALGSFFTVRTAEAAIVVRFGKFLKVAQPGLNWK